MTEAMSKVLMWLFVIDLGVAFGAGLYKQRIDVSRWISMTPDSVCHWNPAAARHDDSGRRFWAFVTTVPLTLFTLASLVTAWWAVGPVRAWWLAASVAALADRILTFSYFIPTMFRLMRAPDSPEAAASAQRWANLNYARHAIVLVAWLAALKAFSLFYGTMVIHAL